MTSPAGPAQAITYRQGTILTWDAVTLEHTVRIGGEGGPTFSNLQVLGVGEATTIQAGSVVGIMCVGSMWAIIGRLVTPNTDEASDAVSLLSSRTASQTVNVHESTTTAASWVDLTTPGPQVTINIGPSGRVILILSAKGGWDLTGADIGQGAFMSAELSGANVMGADTVWGAFIEAQHGSTTYSVISTTMASVYTFEGLTPGLTTFTAKYASGVGGLAADFNRRTITVIAL